MRLRRRPLHPPGVRRRTVLAALASAAPLATPLSALGIAACKPGRDTHVVVIGAGAAGLWAAQLLVNKGFTVTLLEASSRYGGRILADTTLADYPVELGAEEVHGSSSVLYSMCQDANVSFVDSVTEDRFWMADGDGTFALRDEAVLETDDVLAAAARFIDDLYNWSGDDVTVTERLDDAGIADRARFLVEAQVGNEYGSDNDHVGVLSLAEDDALWTSGSGNYALSEASMLSLIELACPDSRDLVQLGAVVGSLQSNETRVTATLTDGANISADYAIVTVPLGVLKAGTIAFDPALSDVKLTAIASVGFGTGMKIILSFSDRFWPDDLGSLYGAEHAPELWAPGLGRSQNPLELTAFVMGAKADALTAASLDGGDQAVFDLILADLDAIFDGAATPALVGAVLQDWTQEPYILGSYSFPSPGSSGLRGDLASAEGRIHFAGEATHTGGMYATVHGALETGERAVQEILDRLGAVNG